MKLDKLGTYEEDTAANTDGSQQGDIIDHGAVGYKIGGGPAPKFLNIVVTSAFPGSGTDTWTFEMEVDSAEAFDTDKKSIISITYPSSDLSLGKNIELPVPAMGYRYSRLTSNRTGSTDSAGKISAFLTY